MLYFKKLFLLTCFLVTGFCSPIFGVNPHTSGIIYADDSDFDSLIENDLSLVFFYEESSAPNHRFMKFFQNLSKQFSDRITFIAVDVNYSYYTLEKYDINTVPTIVLFKDGREVKRHIGYMNLRELYLFILTGIR